MSGHGFKEESRLILAAAAQAGRERSYAPYSHFLVGAALLGTGGRVYIGCNVENASYSVSLCAERSALAQAVAQGERRFIGLAVAGGKEGGPLSLTPPCGLCRQALAEFCGADFPVLLVLSNTCWQELTLGQLLPYGFGPENLTNHS